MSQLLTPARSGTPSRDVPATAVTPVDFRRPSRIGRDAVVALESTHEAFARRLTTSWATSTHTTLEVEHLATEQLSVDDYVRTLPSPTLLATLRVGPLGATALLDLDLPLALILVERLLGGPGDPREAGVNRRPTDLEAGLIAHELLESATLAVDDALRDLDGEPSELLGVETTPQPLQLSAPGELLLLLTYRIELRGDVRAQGLLNLGYPVAPLMAQLDRLVGTGTESDPERELASAAAMAAAVLEAELDVRVRLGGTALSAATMSGLAVGDVLRLDHPTCQPADLVCDERHVGTAHLGRRGRRLAVQVATPLAARAAPGAAPGSAADRAARLYAAGGAAPGSAPSAATAVTTDATAVDAAADA